MSGREMREELRAAKTNRDAAAALVVFTPSHAPAGIAPFDVRAGDVYAVIDPADPDPATLQAAVRLARLLALDLGPRVRGGRRRRARSRPRSRRSASASRRSAALKVQLTNIGSTSENVSKALDKLREAVLAWISRAERELTAS